MCVYSRMARYCLIANTCNTFFQATVIYNKFRARNCQIPFRTTCVALVREFPSGYQSPLSLPLSVLASCHHEVPVCHPKGIRCAPVYIFQIYLQSSGTGESPNVCRKLIILEIFMYGYSGQNRDPISKRAQRRYITTSETP